MHVHRALCLRPCRSHAQRRDRLASGRGLREVDTVLYYTILYYTITRLYYTILCYTILWTIRAEADFLCACKQKREGDREVKGSAMGEGGGEREGGRAMVPSKR